MRDAKGMLHWNRRENREGLRIVSDFDLRGRNSLRQAPEERYGHRTTGTAILSSSGGAELS